MPLSQVSSCLSDPVITVLGVLLPHLAGTVAEKAELAGARLCIWARAQAERTIRPVKVQQRSSGGCWRTLDGLADFAIVQSYLSTATKWGITRIDALRGLFSGHPWMPQRARTRTRHWIKPHPQSRHSKSLTLAE